MVEMVKKFSSHIEAAGYDDKAQELHVHFKNGSRAVYEGVTANVADSVMNAHSVGSALHEFVKGQFNHRKT